MLQIAAPPQAVRWSYCMLLQEIEGTSEEVRRLLYSEQLQRELPRSSDKARALERRAAALQALTQETTRLLQVRVGGRQAAG